jgi:hypothetical protein
MFLQYCNKASVSCYLYHFDGLFSLEYNQFEQNS